MTATERTFWQGILDTRFLVPEGLTATDLLPTLLTFLGSTDPFLRDQVGYSVLAHWIEQGQFTPDQLGQVAAEMCGNFQVGLGKQDSDSVFLRSFSALILAEVIEYHENHSFLSEATVHGYVDQTIAYLHGERDLRGYVTDKGWAHSAAHTADLLRVLANSRFNGQAELDRLLTAIAEKVTAPAHHRFDCDEEDRLVLAVTAILAHHSLPEEQLIQWVERLAQPPGRGRWQQAYRDDAELGARHNTKQFLLSLHYHLSNADSPPPLGLVLVHLLVPLLKNLC